MDRAGCDGGRGRAIPRATIANAGRLIGRPSLEVDGQALGLSDREIVALAPSTRVPLIAAGRAPGEPFHHLLARASASEAATHVLIVAETSAAMTAVERVGQRAAIETVLRALPATANVTLLASDWDVSVLADQVDRAGARQALDKLDGIVSAGALHLERRHQRRRAPRKRPGTAVLFVGRGLDGFDGDAIHGPLGQLRNAGVRLSVLTTNDVPAAVTDAAALTGGEALPAATLGDELQALVAALRARPAPPALAARGLEWHALETVTGQTVWVGRALEIPTPQTNGEPGITAANPTELLPLWDRAQLTWSEHAADRSATTALTPLRALLVLESEQDYVRYGLAAAGGPSRRSGGGRNIASVLGSDSAIGADATDLLGDLVGTQVGTAHGVGGPRPRAADVIPGEASVRGGLDKEIVRRIVRRHLNEVRHCYEHRLPAKLDLRGQITVRFTITASGQVERQSWSARRWAMRASRAACSRRCAGGSSRTRSAKPSPWSPTHSS